MTESPDLPPDAHLRHRLWFRFWRGWRKALIALVVLVVLAWATRPGELAHRIALLRHFEALRQAPPPDVKSDSELIAGFEAGCDQWIDALSLKGTGHGLLHIDGSSPLWSLGQLMSPYAITTTGSIGAFGYVWVLD